MGADGVGLLFWKSPHKWNCMQTKNHPRTSSEHSIVEMRGFCLKKNWEKNSLVVVQSKHSVVVAEGGLKIWFEHFNQIESVTECQTLTLERFDFNIYSKSNLLNQTLMKVKHLKDYETNFLFFNSTTCYIQCLEGFQRI